MLPATAAMPELVDHGVEVGDLPHIFHLVIVGRNLLRNIGTAGIAALAARSAMDLPDILRPTKRRVMLIHIRAISIEGHATAP